MDQANICRDASFLSVLENPFLGHREVTHLLLLTNVPICPRVNAEQDGQLQHLLSALKVSGYFLYNII